MEQLKITALETAKKYQQMLKILPIEAGTVCLDDLEEIYSQDGI